MSRIPKINANRHANERIAPTFSSLDEAKEKNIVFSFESVEKNEFFNLDSTCEKWSNELFDTMQIVSKIKLKEIFAGNYSQKGSTLRIHQHQDVKKPCAKPKNAKLDDMWQIRIAKSKGGIHGVFNDNVFYVIWFDPHHNLYPDEKYGGLKKIKSPKTCCMDRDERIEDLRKALSEKQEECDFYKECLEEIEDK